MRQGGKGRKDCDVCCEDRAVRIEEKDGKVGVGRGTKGRCERRRRKEEGKERRGTPDLFRHFWWIDASGL